MARYSEAIGVLQGPRQLVKVALGSVCVVVAGGAYMRCAASTLEEPTPRARASRLVQTHTA